MEFISQPWPWYVAGPLITLVMLLMLYFGKRFGVSSNLRTMCAIGGGGKAAEFFRFEWKQDVWNLVFIMGALVGGFIAHQFMTKEHTVAISDATKEALRGFGLTDPGSDYVPKEIFSWENLGSTQGIIMMIVGGFFIGFGTRYGNGCTSGHGISGLSNLQWTSLVAVIGFFIGGMITTFFVLPKLLSL